LFAIQILSADRSGQIPEVEQEEERKNLSAGIVGGKKFFYLV
jgi:hypothetical protein